MTSAPPPDPKELSGLLKRIGQLGNMTETVFSRLYLGLRRKSSLQADPEWAEKARKLQEHNQKLKQMLAERNAEVERLSAVLESIGEGVIVQDVEGRVVLMNQIARQLLGNQRNFWDSELGTLFDAQRQLDKIPSELALVGEPTRVQVNNRILGVQLAAIADPLGNRIGTLIMLKDTTRDALAERLKDGFVTHISHELKTPMTVIKLASEMLSGQPGDQPANRRVLETLTRNVDILDRMIIELLDISEMSSGMLDIRRDIVNVEEILWSVVNGHRLEIEKARLDVKVIVRDLDTLYIVGDDQRLRWALSHLLRNAILYTPRGGHITLWVRLVMEKNQKYVHIEVQDTGVGISDKDLPHIFDRFYRGEPRTKEGKRLDPRGLGQGLFVARTVAEAHGGHLSVRTTLGEGSRFIFAIPVGDLPQDLPA